MENIDSAYGKFCEERFPLASEKDVAALEMRLRISLPPDYRRFLLEYNGGFFTEPRITPPTAGCPADRLTVLYGIRATHPSGELAKDSDLALFDNNDPLQILPIGYTLMGNLIFIVTHVEGRGGIGLKTAFADDSYSLGDGIEDFFSLLCEPPVDRDDDSDEDSEEDPDE